MDEEQLAYKPIPGYGPDISPLMIVGEAGGFYEEQLGMPLVGPTGKKTEELLEPCGVRLEDCYRTNVILARPPDNNLKRLGEIGLTLTSHVNELWEDIARIQPNCILALGGLALNILTGKSGITKWRGSVLTCSRFPHIKVVPTIHPSNLINPRGGEVRDFTANLYVQFDFQKAVEQSQTSSFREPEALVEIAHSLHDVKVFFDRYKKQTKCSTDIEVFKAIPFCIGYAFNEWHALCVPLLNVKEWEEEGVGIPREELARIWKFIAEKHADPRMQWIGQNFKFDHDKINKIGLPIPIANVWFDTMLAHAALWPQLPHKLEFLTSIYTDFPYYKDELKTYRPGIDKLEQVFEYNGKDVIVTKKVQQEEEAELEELGLTDFFHDFIMPLHGLYMHIDGVGMLTDENKRAELWEKYTELTLSWEAELFEKIGRVVLVTSPPQLKKLLYEELKFPPRKDTKEDTLVALQSNGNLSKDKRRILDLIIDIRRSRKSMSTYIGASYDFDRRMRTNYRIHGAESGRTSTSMLKPPVRPYEIGLAFQTITKHGEIGADIGTMYVPDPGCVFLTADQKQAEARVVARLARDEELLEKFDTIDVHKWTAEFCLNIPQAQVTQDERYIGKTGRHMCNYGAKKRRLMHEINTGARRFHINVSVSEWKAGQILDKIHAATPNIRAVFHADVIEQLESQDRVLWNPWGRRIQFADPWGERLFFSAFSWIPQGGIGDFTKVVMRRTSEKVPFPIFIEAHDGFGLIVPEKEVGAVREIIEEIGKTPIPLDRCSLEREPLQIPWEFEVGYNFKEMEKLK